MKIKFNIVNYLSHWVKKLYLGFINTLKEKIYTIRNLKEVNRNLGLYHLANGNIKDAIFRFYILSKFIDPQNPDAQYLLAWSYFMNGNIIKSSKELESQKISDQYGLKQYIQQYQSLTHIPNKISDYYKTLSVENIYTKYFNSHKSLSNITIKSILEYFQTMPKDFSILDLGCQGGLIGAELQENLDYDLDITGTEENDILFNNANKIANEKGKRIYNDVLKVNTSEFLNATHNKQYSLIVCFDSLSFMKNLENILVQIHNITKENGLLAIILKKSNNITRISSDGITFEYTQSDLEHQLKVSNFAIQQIQYIEMKKNTGYFIILASKTY